MGVRGRLLRDLLSSLKIIKNLSEQQIRASLWRGEGLLYNIEFDPKQLQELLVDVCPVGLEILSLHVDELYAKIPWSQLGTQSVLIVAKCVTVRFEMHCEDDVEWRETIGPLLRHERQKKQRALYAAPGSLTDPAGTLNQLRQRMLHSLQLRADHIRISISSRHHRHLSAHRPEAPVGLEEALVVDLKDVSLTPCDAERNPSDQMKQMAIYDPQERVLQLMRLLKCRAFSVLPPAGPPPCPHAATEFMEAPCVLQCSIVDRCTSDGPRICPVLLSTDLLFDIPQQLRVRCCECQLCAFLALLSDVGQMEEWRLDEALVCGRQPEVLPDTSDVARTFAQGPATRAKQRSGSGSSGRPQSLIRATSAFGVSSSFFSSSSSSSSKQRPGRDRDSPSEADRFEEAESEAVPPGEVGLALEEEDEEQEPLEQEEDEALFLDAEELDYFSVASTDSPSSASEAPKSGSSDWLHKMRSWFRSSPALQQCEQGTTVDLCTQRTRLALSICTLLLQLTVQKPEAPAESADLQYTGEQVSICIDTRFELTEAQKECVRRFAWPEREERPSALWPWQLPRRMGASQRLDFQRFTLEFGGAELLRDLRQGEQSEGSEESMLVLLLRPRSAPAETLVSLASGELSNWPSQLTLRNAQLVLEVQAIAAMVALYKRVKPCLASKLPPPELIAPTGQSQSQGQGQGQGQSPVRSPQQLFPAQCLLIEFNACEFLEPGDAAIREEQRWPWRGFVPHLVMRSDSALWDLAAPLSVVSEGPPGSPEAARSREVPRPQEGMVSIPQEMFDELVRRAAETTRKDAEVSAARDELQRAYISLATSRPHGHGVSASASAFARAAGLTAASDAHSDDEQDELDRLRQKCLQLELSLQSQALAQRRLETELAHQQARAQEELRRLLVVGRGRSA